MKVTTLVVLLCLFYFVSAFDETQKISQFLDSQPHPLIRIDFDFPSEAVGAGSINVKIIADLGYYLEPDGSGYGDLQIRYYDDPDYLRNVRIFLRTPSGSHNLYLGKFFNNQWYDNGNYLADSFFYLYYPTGFTLYPFYNNFYQDVGHYNALHNLIFYFEANLWQQIVHEGSASIVFEFSSEVNSYYLIYPFSNVFNSNYPGEEFLSVEVYFADAAALGDPHFFGWNGASFDFQGENHHIYNLISHRDVQVNFQMKQRNFFSVSSIEEIEQLSHNTYIGTMGFKTKSHELVLFSGESGFDDAGYIELDGVKYPVERDSKLIHSDAEITIEWVAPVKDVLNKKDPIAGILYVETGIFTLKVYFIEAGRSLDNFSEWHSHPFRFFDVFASITEHDEILRGRMHGVLGQTGDHVLSLKPTGADKWSIEGTFEDYRVSSLFADDFKFNLFRH